MSAAAGSGAPDLLAAAAKVLRQNGFAVGIEALEGAPSGWLLAESDLFIVAVAAAPDLNDLRRMESFAAPELIERLAAEPGVGGKRWDAYLVLMASEDADSADDARKLIDIEYDTRGLRRLVAVAVEPTVDDLRRVLRPFIPLPPPSPTGLTDALDELQAQLVLNGVADKDAARVLAAFQDRGHLNDV